MTVHDVSTLAALIAAYEKAVVFEESTPGALRIAKAFPELHWSNGGLLLLGVRKDGTVIGVDESEVDGIFSKFAHLCAELTKARVEIGLLRCDDRLVVFLVFNAIPRLTSPLDRYAGSIERIAMV
ncbi:ATP-binding protein [Luteolibacter flavescens]|uniref:ATP-binding protein n=1 Tax=Luteolibacter flavescens TaxID=1859460 RepID=A0ABT3FTF8_9BACT|nr:ATP-binding protein [Luteolibacter flavescens]MCW1886747.1 ATP-binding protein [Luteolibacter flavescens]